jgi:hypothetical protein
MVRSGLLSVWCVESFRRSGSEVSSFLRMPKRARWPLATKIGKVVDRYNLLGHVLEPTAEIGISKSSGFNIRMANLLSWVI